MSARYNVILLGVAVFVWLLALSAVFAQPAWLDLIEWMGRQGVGVGARRTFLGSVLLLVVVVSFAGAIAHVCICIVPSLRVRYRPRLLSHLAAVALLWLAYGGVVVVLSGAFPYLAR